MSTQFQFHLELALQIMKDITNYLSQQITGFDPTPNQVLHQKLHKKFNNHKNALVKSQKVNQATNSEQVIAAVGQREVGVPIRRTHSQV